VRLEKTNRKYVFAQGKLNTGFSQPRALPCSNARVNTAQEPRSFCRCLSRIFSCETLLRRFMLILVELKQHQLRKVRQHEAQVHSTILALLQLVIH
jgi:hypothetical protein